MFKINRFTLVSLLLVGAFLLSACGGTLPNSIPLGDGTEVEIESSNADEGNSNDANANDDNSNDDNGNDVNDDDDNGNDDSGNDDNSNDDNSNSGNENGDDVGDEVEVFGLVEAITADSVTINGVTYQFADFTEFKDAIAVGDQVKIHVIVNADGTFTIREIEKSDDLEDDENSNDDDSNGNDNENENSNDDDNSNGNGGNSNDDDDDNGNDNDDD